MTRPPRDRGEAPPRQPEPPAPEPADPPVNAPPEEPEATAASTEPEAAPTSDATVTLEAATSEPEPEPAGDDPGDASDGAQDDEPDGTASPASDDPADAGQPADAEHPLEPFVGPIEVTFRAAGHAGPAREACVHNAPRDECEACGVEIPLDEGEEILTSVVRFEQTLDSDEPVAVLYFVTSAGRKVGIDPDGWIAVVTGPDLDAIQPPAPKPPRASWKDPRD